MAVNFLEQLVAEWYEYQKFFVLRNQKVGKRAKGGYDCELDIIGYRPTDNRLVHIETSTDADSWAERERRITKKFKAGRDHIHKLFDGLPDLPKVPDQIAVFAFGGAAPEKIAGGELLTLRNLFRRIEQTLGQESP